MMFHIVFTLQKTNLTNFSSKVNQNVTNSNPRRMEEEMKVFNIKGQSQKIGDVLGKGGEAEVHLMKSPELSDTVFKKYLPKTIQKHGKETLEKIEAMQQIESLRLHPNLSWPRVKCYDSNKVFIGYTMNKAKGKSFLSLINYKNAFPHLTRKKLVAYLINYVKLVDKLHKQGVMIGDYNIMNFFFDPNSDQIYLIDCDSFQVKTDKKLYYCTVGTPDIVPKEHQDKDFAKVRRTLASERFSIAVILFRLLNGKHPYDHIGGTEPKANIAKGLFPYELNGAFNAFTPKGPWHQIWKDFPYELKKLFITTFRDGADTPAKRATLAQWIKALENYQHGLNKGYYKNEMRPTTTSN